MQPARQRPISLEERRAEDRRRLADLRRSPAIGPAVKLAYEWLWEEVGYEPGTITITRGGLAEAFGTVRRAAWRWINTLEEVGLVHVIDQDRRTGRVYLEIYEPRLDVRQSPVEADPQGELFPEPEEPSEDSPPLRVAGGEVDQDDAGGTFGRANVPGGDICARERPQRGHLGAQTSPAGTSVRANVPSGDICARERPQRGHLGAQTSQKPPEQRTLEGLCHQICARGEAIASTIPAGAGARALGTKNTKSNIPSYQDPKYQEYQEYQAQEPPEAQGAQAQEPPGGPPPDEAGPLEGALSAAAGELARTTDPADQHRRLVRRILEAVPELREPDSAGRGSTWLAHRLANLVAGGMPAQELDRVLIDVAEMRRGERGLQNPAAFLNHKYQALADRFENGRHRQRE